MGRILGLKPALVDPRGRLLRQEEAESKLPGKGRAEVVIGEIFPYSGSWYRVANYGPSGIQAVWIGFTKSGGKHATAERSTDTDGPAGPDSDSSSERPADGGSP